ncbi:hypothetical protein CKG00_16805 (plasmid) [Morganella morganii]|uniref:Uncharacterized protein n=1 Tax=Morganella morganii TaxID=582 RepID=A0A433ZRU2_MORMO|nr:hypothetical protein [Morganella morganii]RUT64802.1 hypothetical protein CKG00_16805 [Morganella morganii]
MQIASRMAGIALQDGELRIALARYKCRRWCFEDFITLTLPEAESAENGVPGLSVVAAALGKWRRRIRGTPGVPGCAAGVTLSSAADTSAGKPRGAVCRGSGD